MNILSLNSMRAVRVYVAVSAVFVVAPACSVDSTASESDAVMTTTESTTTEPTATESTATESTATEPTATGPETSLSSGSTGDSTGSTGDSTGSTGDTTGSTGDTTGSTGFEGTPSFTDIYEEIILPQGCNAGYCHGGGAGGLMMTDEATSYANLVEMEAAQPTCGAAILVVPGSPDESVLWYRTRPMALDEGMEPCALKMPKGSTGLDEADGELLLAWIAGGAPE